MRIVLAPDKFKGSLSAQQACEAMSRGIARADPTIQVDSIPLADGGEGTVDALVRAMNGKFITRRVTGPLPEMKVDATFGIVDSPQTRGAAPGVTAVIEMSAASGISLLKPQERDPLATTTFGTGELIRIAIDEFNCSRIILGIGGSATIDGGIGAAQACGMPIILEDGEPVAMTEPLCGRDVQRVVLIKHGRGDHLGNTRIDVACDVTNPLVGPNGAAQIYGAQKGATTEAISQLDRALQQLAHRTGHDDLAQTPGAGAAGGLGFGMLAFFGATLQRGANLIIDAVNLRDRLRGADLCITGEGKIDQQTPSGKLVQVVNSICLGMKIQCIAIAGQVDLHNPPFDARSIVQRNVSLDDAMVNASSHIERIAEQIARTR